jgi:hypothetical protein
LTEYQVFSENKAWGNRPIAQVVVHKDEALQLSSLPGAWKGGAQRLTRPERDHVKSQPQQPTWF